MEVLIELARYGAQLRVYTEPLKIGDASVISLTVDPSDPVVPLELVYDGEAPGWDAKLCTAAHGAGSCRRASAAVVCPYAFWGLTRTIARAIERRDANPNTHKPRSLDLRPVLYAAADRADDHAPPNEKPSDLLRAALETFAGADSLTQVRTWALWTSSVSSKRPELLVVLGHTETLRDEVNLEIGKGEFLARPEVEARFIGMQGAAPPLVVLIACATAASGDMWAGLPTAFASKGAAAVVATLTKLNGAQGALAAAQVVGALRATTDGQQRLLGAALRTARRDLVSQGLLVGLLLVSHGEIDVQLTKT
jgi:hypothetical protein